VSDPGLRDAAVVDLLALLAFGELQAFDQMAADARLAPDLHRRAVLSEMAAAEIVNHRRLAERLTALGANAEATMRPFVAPLERYHNQTAPKDWLEALAKAYVGDGIADDFYHVVALHLASPDRELVLEVLHDSRYADFAASEIRSAIAADPKVANRLSIWARRLVGEGLSQAQRVAAERPSLALLLVAEGADPDAIGGLFKRLTGAHTARMTAVGLNN